MIEVSIVKHWLYINSRQMFGMIRMESVGYYPHTAIRDCVLNTDYVFQGACFKLKTLNRTLTNHFERNPNHVIIDK